MVIKVDAVLINRWNLAHALGKDLDMHRNDYKDLVNFILDIDSTVCDVRFTKALYDRLGSILELENQ